MLDDSRRKRFAVSLSVAVAITSATLVITLLAVSGAIDLSMFIFIVSIFPGYLVALLGSLALLRFGGFRLLRCGLPQERG